MKVNALEYICTKITESEDFNERFESLIIQNSDLILNSNTNESNVNLNPNDQNKILKYCDFLSSSEKSLNKNLALKLIALIDGLTKEDDYKELIKKSILTKYGLFSAVDVFSPTRIETSATASIISEIRKIRQAITGTNEVYTNNQYDLYRDILNEKYFSFSGPTSIGKSFLIKNCAIQLSKNYKNIIFILPTKALLDEFIISFRKIINEQNIKDLNIGKTISKLRRDKNNILILTQERYNSLLYAQEFLDINIDILFVDEAHKLLEKKNKRAITLFKVINKSITRFPEMKLIFSCPIISNPEILLNIFNIENGASRTIKESPVSQNLYSINIGRKECHYYDTITNKVIELPFNKTYLSDFELIYSIGVVSDSNLVYLSSRQNCINSAISFKNYLISNGEEATTDEELVNESDLISDFIHNEFSLAELLKYRIAFHHGGLPPFIRKRIEDLYAKRKIKYIFCTSTLLEGVNLPTKNVFIYPFKVSNSEESSKLNFWNLAGRAGRYKNELTGNIFCINKPDDNFNQEEIFSKNEVKLDNNLNAILASNKRVLNYLNDSVKNPEPSVVQYSTILLSEILAYKKTKELGPNLLSIPHSNRVKIINAGENFLIRKKINDIDVSVFSENHTINSEIQSKAYKYAKDKKNILSSFKRDEFFSYIKMINDIYDLFNNKIIHVIQGMAYSWVRGKSINSIINDSIEYSNVIYINYQKFDFNRNDPEHINIKISQVISTLENDIGFKLETSVNHFFQLCKSIHGEELSGINLAKFLEYGTTNSKNMAIQEYGFSRIASIQLLKNYSDYLKFDENDELQSIDLKSIIKNSDEDILLNREAKWLT